MSRADVVVVGGGSNGLVAAAVLAKAGRRVTLLESRPVFGGVAAAEEFHPGYRTAGLLHDASLFSPAIARELQLDRHGLVFDAEPPPVLLLDGSGPGILLARDAEAARAEIAARAPGDADAYARFRDFLARVGPAIRGVLGAPPPDVFAGDPSNLFALARQGLSVRRLGRRDFAELLRIPPMCAADWLREYFSCDLLSAGLAGPAIYGNFVGPWSPGTAAVLLRREALAEGTARGGPARIASALEAAARAAGAELRAGAAVRRIAVESGRVAGVLLADGERIETRAVIAACEPRRVFLDWLPPEAVPARLVARLRAWRVEGTAAKVHLALARAPVFAARPDLQVEHARVGASLDDLERSFDPVKYGRAAESPALDIRVPSVVDAALAPPGGAVVSVLAHGAPRSLQGGWTGAAREAFGDRVVAHLESVAPGLAASVVGRQVLSPADLETVYGLPGGHADHGEQSLDQLLCRPAPECAAHATPLPGLFLGSMGAWPGGGVTGLPGRLAARALLAARIRT